MRPFLHAHIYNSGASKLVCLCKIQNGQSNSVPESVAKLTERNLADAKQVSLDKKNLSIKDAAKCVSKVVGDAPSTSMGGRQQAPQPSASKRASNGGSKVQWDPGMVPSYLQRGSNIDSERDEFGYKLDDFSQASSTDINPIDRASMDIWKQIKKEAARDAAKEPLLSSYLYASIMAQQSLEQALAFVLANRMASQTLLATQLFELFYDVIRTHADVRKGAVMDLQAFRDRDPACASFAQALLYYKGYHALQVYRISHALWNDGRQVMALALQSQSSEVFATDIHPAARIGFAVMLDHASGVVIGETARVGNNVSILQGVTLGGTGKEQGDRHPKIADDVLIGAQATILGNIHVGQGVQVASGSLVLKDTPPHSLVAGAPAQVIQYLCESECPGVSMGTNFDVNQKMYGESPVTIGDDDQAEEGKSESQPPEKLSVRYTLSDKQALEMFGYDSDANATYSI